MQVKALALVKPLAYGVLIGAFINYVVWNQVSTTYQRPENSVVQRSVSSSSSAITTISAPAKPNRPPSTSYPTPAAVPLLERQYKEVGYFDPFELHGIRPIPLPNAPKKFFHHTPAGIEFNPSIAVIPSKIADWLHAKLGKDVKPVYVASLKCKDNNCKIRNPNMTRPKDNGGFCNGSGGGAGTNIVVLDAAMNLVARAILAMSFPWKEVRDLRLYVHDERLYASGLHPHNPPRWCFYELTFGFDGIRKDYTNTSRDPGTSRHGGRQKPGVFLADLVPVRTSMRKDPLDLCMLGSARNIIPLWHEDSIYFASWLARPYQVLQDLGIHRKWEERAWKAGHNDEGSPIEFAPDRFGPAYEQFGEGEKAAQLSQLAMARHSPNTNKVFPPLKKLRGVNDLGLHGNGFAVQLPDGRLLTMGHIHTDFYEPKKGPYVFGNTYYHYFIFLENKPPYKFLVQSPPFCFPSDDNMSLCEGIQFVMSALILPTSLEQDDSDPLIRFTYGRNDCDGATADLSLSEILSFTGGAGSLKGQSVESLLELYNLTSNDPEVYTALERCVIESSSIDTVRRLNPKTGNEASSGSWHCRCGEGFKCAGLGCSEFSNGDGRWFPAFCEDCQVWCQNATL